MLSLLTKLIREPLLEKIDLDGADRIAAHLHVLKKKRMIREVFEEFYRIIRTLDDKFFVGDGLRVELGAGVSFMKTLFPDVTVTDVVPAPHIDLVLDAQDMHLQDGSVRAFYGVNCFHHFPDPEAFFRQTIRCLQPGGGIILIEPYYGWLARFLYPRLFASEGFDLGQRDWRTPSTGPMRGANQALSYIVFERDRIQFSERFPTIEIVKTFPLINYVRYLLSGGLNFRQLAPDISCQPLQMIEILIRPLCRYWALHQVIVLRRRKQDSARGPSLARDS